MNLFSSPHSFFPFISSKLKPFNNLFKVQYKLTLLIFQFRPGGLSIYKCRQISSILVFSFVFQFSLLFYDSFTCCKILNKQIIMGYSFLFKYILIGDQSVGKSCILLHFTEKNFQIESNPTIGVEFGSKNIQIKDKEVKLQIWDTAGQQVYKSITRSYYRGTIGAILVYDITNRKSFDNILKWVQELKTYAMNDKVTILMVGNKEDLSQSRQVSYEQANALAQKVGMKFIESSAKTGLNIQHIFQSLTQFIVERIQKGEINTNDESIGVKVGERQTMRLQKNSKRCCY